MTVDKLKQSIKKSIIEFNKKNSCSITDISISDISLIEYEGKKVVCDFNIKIVCE